MQVHEPQEREEEEEEPEQQSDMPKEAEGFRLYLSSRSSSGYMGVIQKGNKWQVGPPMDVMKS